MKSTLQGPPAFMKRRKQKSNLGRHKRNCSVCCHPKLAEIEADFISWQSPAAIAEEYGLADRASLYRHASGFSPLVAGISCRGTGGRKQIRVQEE